MRSIAKAGLAAVLFWLPVAAPASALELKQAIENCRNTVGKPIVMACMSGGRGNLESCRASAGPRVKACVQSAMAASRPKAQLFDAAKISAPKPEEAAADAAALTNKAPASLVAPPRTITDVAAILDQQKPDAGKIAELTATAEAPVPAGLKGPALAAFPLQARAGKIAAWPHRRRAGRRRDLRSATDRAAITKMSASRYEQFLMRRLREAGQHKRANALLSKQVATFANQAKGGCSGSTTRCWSVISETATSTRRKTMPRAIVRCLRKRSVGRFFRSTARTGRPWSKTAMRVSRKRADVGGRRDRPFTRRRSFIRPR